MNQLYQENVELSSSLEQVRPAAYYAVIPAEVRYNQTLSAGAKLLYGEISALATRDGYCWASNPYFADLYQTTERTISRQIALLEQCGFIRTVEQRSDLTGKVTGRRIYLTPGEVSMSGGHPVDKNVQGGRQFCPQGVTFLSTGSTNNNKYNIYIGDEKKNPSTAKLREQFFRWLIDCGAEPEVAQYVLDAFDGFFENRKAIKKPMKSARAITILCNRLDKFCGRDFAQMAELLDEATAHNWQTVYQPKDGGAGGSGRLVEEPDILWK